MDGGRALPCRAAHPASPPAEASERRNSDQRPRNPALGREEGPLRHPAHDVSPADPCNTVASFTGDGAYDQEGVYAGVAERHPEAAVIVPPRSSAVPGATATTAPTQRDRHLRMIAERGRMGWQKASGYNLRAL